MTETHWMDSKPLLDKLRDHSPWDEDAESLIEEAANTLTQIIERIRALPEYQYGTDSVRRSDVLYILEGEL